MDDEAVTRARTHAAEAAAAEVTDGMALGLGTGRTAALFLEALSRRVAEGLSIKVAVATSAATYAAARAAELPVVGGFGPAAPTRLDLAVDGADEIDPELRLIKGGGGALLREKIVAQMADRFVVIVDQAKTVDQLGAFPLPVEILPFGSTATLAQIGGILGVTPHVRGGPDSPLHSDNGNLIVDCPLKHIEAPEAVAAALTAIPGVVDHGLFVSEASAAFVGTPDGVERHTRPE